MVLLLFFPSFSVSFEILTFGHFVFFFVVAVLFLVCLLAKHCSTLYSPRNVPPSSNHPHMTDEQLFICVLKVSQEQLFHLSSRHLNIPNLCSPHQIHPDGCGIQSPFWIHFFPQTPQHPPALETLILYKFWWIIQWICVSHLADVLCLSNSLFFLTYIF